MLPRRLVLPALLLAIGCRRPNGVVDLQGRPLDPLANAAAVTTLVFLSTICPISNRYAPELKRLRERFATRGVSFAFVYPNKDEPEAAVRDHAAAFGFGPGVLRDLGHTLVRRSGVTVTPEAAVFLPDGKLAYRGRIDDRFIDFGHERPTPTQRDLERALTDVLAGRPTPATSGPALGCAIVVSR